MSNFISVVEGDIIAMAEAAWSQTKAELLTLEAAILADIKADINAVLTTLAAGVNSKTVEEIETELLNLWESQKPQIIQALSSGAIQILITMAKTALATAI
jgi:hypothetical protein